MWKCPSCQRKFKNEFQNHSCTLLTEKDLFNNRPVALKNLYDHVLKEVRKFAEFRIEIVPPDVAFLKTESTFMAIKVKKRWLDIQFFLDYLESHELIKKFQKTSNRRYTYIVSIDDFDQFDEQLINWCRSSYELITK